MKCEPHGTLNFNFVNVKQLGLQNASQVQLQLIFILIISKHVSLVDGTFICLNIPIIHKCCAVKYINSKPQVLCTKLVTKSRILGFDPIDIFISKPIQFEQLIFAQYFKNMIITIKYILDVNDLEKIVLDLLFMIINN
jgi:hypothetical protein